MKATFYYMTIIRKKGSVIMIIKRAHGWSKKIMNQKGAEINVSSPLYVPTSFKGIR